jgi:3-oxoacyl-[acyl-carrier protein] reductase
MNPVELADEQARGALKGKVAIVTGAGRGVGRAIALGYARAGADVCCVARSEDEISATVELIQGEGGSGLAVTADVSDLKSVEAMVSRTIERFGGIDILLLSHGVMLSVGPIEQSDPEMWKKTVDINLAGTYYCVRSAVPHLKARGAGKIIVVGSGQGHNGTAGTSAYSSSKAGVWGLAQSLAAELVSFNISVNELLPGNVKTKLYDDTFQAVVAATPPGAEPLSKQRSHEWLKQPEDVVPLALFLACQPDVGPTAQIFSLMRRF